MKSIITILLGLFICLPVAGADKKKITKKYFEETKAKAEKGNKIAQFFLGMMYGNGEGVLEDDKEAVKWYRKAADQGYAEAQYNLGNMYANGEGVAKDFKESVKWCRKAAEKGHVKAQYNLGSMYYFGDGVEKDNVTAYAWSNIATANGLERSRERKSLIAKEMTPEQISKAKALSKEMVKKNPKLIKKP